MQQTDPKGVQDEVQLSEKSDLLGIEQEIKTWPY